MISVDLPPPETPVTQVNSPSGIVAVTFFRLLPRAPTIFSSRPGSRRGASPESRRSARPTDNARSANWDWR